MLEQLHKEFPEAVRLVFRHFPLPSHPNALLAAQAVEAAGIQGKYYEFSDHLFATQADWSSLDIPAFETWLLDQSGTFGFNRDQFAADMKSDAIVQKVKGYQDAALKANVSYTPFVMLNGRTYQNVVNLTDISNLRFLVKLLGNSGTQYTECPPTVIKQGKSYTATIETEKGNIVVDIAAEEAPATANGLIWLIQQGWYDNTTFNFVQRGTDVGLEYAITGDHTLTGAGTPGFTYALESSDTLKFDKPGVVGFLNGNQLFFTYAAVPDLDGKYTVVGEVTEGQEILDGFTGTTTTADGNLSPGVKIIKITIAER